MASLDGFAKPTSLDAAVGFELLFLRAMERILSHAYRCIDAKRLLARDSNR